MKQLKISIALLLMIGFPNAMVSVYFLDMGHSVLLAPLSYVCAFIGTGLIYGFEDFTDQPKYIGNVDNNYTKPRINQNWIVFFICLIINLTVANLCGNV